MEACSVVWDKKMCEKVGRAQTQTLNFHSTSKKKLGNLQMLSYSLHQQSFIDDKKLVYLDYF